MYEAVSYHLFQVIPTMGAIGLSPSRLRVATVE
jgi:hypothetical protein